MFFLLMKMIPLIVLSTPKCKIMSPFALKLFQKEKNTLKKVAFYEKRLRIMNFQKFYTKI
jgi:hypothetical protein